MTKEISGKRLFLLYAYPCAEGRLILRKIDKEHFDRLVKLVHNGEEPTAQLLRYCFPHAFRRLREYANETSVERWDFATVADFWRHHHGHKGDCRVSLGKVVEVINEVVTRIADNDGFEIRALNLYDLPVNIGDRLYLHRRVLVEKAE
jgi:hypothetical protein